jgi:signal transduction histidine kinase
MSDLVDDLFDVVQLDSGQLDVECVEFDVGEVIASAIADTLQAPVASRVRTTLPDERTALGDPRRTRQVVSNLLTNAAKFSGPEQPIDIDVERGPGSVSVAVIDHGPGIPLGEQHLLFQRFSRLSTGQETPGSGIGLFIARSLIEAQRGQIEVRSSPGNGSTFRFTLPAAS